jgi:hypothetical protein
MSMWLDATLFAHTDAMILRLRWQGSTENDAKSRWAIRLCRGVIILQHRRTQRRLRRHEGARAIPNLRHYAACHGAFVKTCGRKAAA